MMSCELPRTVRVLIAEDNPTMRGILRRMLLEFPGVDVVAEASSGPEAISAARAAKPDLALVDLHLPEIDGVEATRQIIKESLSNVVGMSALVEPWREQQVRGAGALGCVAKTDLQEQLPYFLDTVRGSAAD